MSLEFKAFCQLIDEIKEQGYEEETAAHFAAIIGDIPIRDDTGRIIVLEAGEELARLEPLRFFGLAE